MICSNSKYNENGDLIYRITAGEKTFPEVLEVEYDDNGNLLNQSLYDLIKTEKGEHKKLKLRTEVRYNDEGKVVGVTTPETITEYDYTPTEIEVELIQNTLVAKTTSHVTNLIKNEDGSDKPDTICYIIDHTGTFKINILSLDYDSIRMLESYKKGTKELICTEYYLFKGKDTVYYENRDESGKTTFMQSFEYNENGKPQYIITEDFNHMQTTVLKIEYPDFEEMGLVIDNNEFRDTIYNTSKRVIDMNTDDEIIVEESKYVFEDEGEDRKKLSNIINLYYPEEKEESEYTINEYIFDDKGRMIKHISNDAHVVRTIVYPYDGDDLDEMSRMYVRHTEPKKITQFTTDKSKQNAKNEDIYLYAYSIYEEKVISLELVKYASGYIVKTVKITVGDDVVGEIITNNGEDATVGVLFDTLYETYK